MGFQGCALPFRGCPRPRVWGLPPPARRSSAAPPQLLPRFPDRSQNRTFLGYAMSGGLNLADRLRSIVTYLAAFESLGFKLGVWRTPPASRQGVIDLPYFATNEAVSAFIEAAYHNNWVAADFDWPEWTQTQEAKDLRDDPEALARANPEQ